MRLAMRLCCHDTTCKLSRLQIADHGSVPGGAAPLASVMSHEAL